VIAPQTLERLLGGASFHALDSGRVDARASAHPLALSDLAVLYRTDRQAQAPQTRLPRSTPRPSGSDR
jgi:DNA helicase-2/ATP-dependent DNA helicase PcrA